MFGLGNKKIGSIHLGNTKIAKAYLGDKLVFDGTKSTMPDMNVGNIINWAGYEWIVVNDNEDGTVVLAMKDVYLLTAFNTNGYAAYSGSTIATRAKTLEDSLDSDLISQAVDVTVSGVTSKVFVPTYTQVFNRFSYFQNDNSRIAYFNGVAKEWWLSSNYNSVYIDMVWTTGKRSWDQPGYTHGFRPFVTLKKS